MLLGFQVERYARLYKQSHVVNRQVEAMLYNACLYCFVFFTHFHITTSNCCSSLSCINASNFILVLDSVDQSTTVVHKLRTVCSNRVKS